MKSIKIIRKITALTAMLVGVTGRAGDSAPFLLDTTDPLITAPITYNSAWVGGDSSAEVVITDNGTEIKRTTGEGEFAWTPITPGKHTLTYTTYIDGVAQDEVYTATVFKDWKYTIEDGKATIVETTETIRNSDSLVIPHEIDGHMVTSIDIKILNDVRYSRDIVIPSAFLESIDINDADWEASLSIATVDRYGQESIRYERGLKSLSYDNLYYWNQREFRALGISINGPCLVFFDVGFYTGSDQYISVYINGKSYMSIKQDEPRGKFWLSKGSNSIRFDTHGGKAWVNLPAKRFGGRYTLSALFPSLYSEVRNLVLSGESLHVSQYSFLGCEKLESISIPQGCTIKEWCSEGSSGWRFGTNGVLRSGKIGCNASSEMNMTVAKSGRLKYKWKASSEYYKDDSIGVSDVFDYGYLEVDGKALGLLKDYKLEGVSIGGHTKWQDVEVDLTGEGPHTIRWIYAKDEYDDPMTIGEDCIWVDDIRFMPLTTVEFDIGSAIGAPPSTITEICDTKINLPIYFGFQKPKYTLTGWSDGNNTYSPGGEFELRATNVTLVAVYDANTIGAPKIESSDVVDGGILDAASATIKMSCDKESTIYYTLDGSIPTATSAKYTGEFEAFGLGEVTIKAIALKDDCFDSDVTTFKYTRRPFTLSESVNANGVSVMSTSASPWFRVLGEESYDGSEAIRSGAIGPNELSSVEMIVENEGMISFWWKVSSHEDPRGRKFDYMAFFVDDVEIAWISGEKDWVNVTYQIADAGTHTLKWVYMKNGDAYVSGEDCAWLDKVMWMGGTRFDITYENLRGATHTNPETYQERSVVEFTDPSGVEGYTFAGWTPERITADMTGAQTVRANWTANNYTIAYNPNGGNGTMESTLATYDSEAIVKDNEFIRDGYTFKGWALEEGGDVAYVPGQNVMNLTAQAGGVVTLYAKWADSHKFIVDENGVLTDVILGNDTVVTIPDSVTSIGDYAFSCCSLLTSVTIPDSVTSIGDYAFEYCSSLTSVTIPDSVTSIGDYAFECCGSLQSFTVNSGNDYYKSVDGLLLSKDGKVLIVCPGGKKSVVIPDSVTSIGDSAFFDCSSLTSVTIPDSVTSIGDYAFSCCSSLTSVTIPDSVTSIGDYAFSCCSSLTSVTIPDSVTSIGDSAFEGCSSLTSVTIPDSVTSIGDYAFAGCSSLTRVSISQSLRDQVESGGVFDRCPKLQIVWREVVDWRYTISNGEVTITGISQEPSGEIIIPSRIDGYPVTSIGDRAFDYCSSLTSVTIPDSVTRIGDDAFKSCSSLTSVTIPEGVTSIGSEAFAHCSSLTSVTIPNSVTSIGDDAFYDCSSLTSVTIPNSVTRIGDSAFRDCSSLTSVTIPNSVTSIGDYAFYDCTSLTSVTIPDSVTRIGDSAFRDCSSLTSVTIPDSVTSIWYRTFYGCSSLTSVTIPDSVTSIYPEAFEDCSSLTSVTIPDSVTSIGGSAFEDCSSLTSVTIPDSVTSIGGSAFSGCSSLTSVTIPDSVTSVGNYAFYDCSSLTSVTIPDSVTSIGIAAFAFCSSLTSVTIPDSVTSIGSSAFAHCSSLTRASISESLRDQVESGDVFGFSCSALQIVWREIVHWEYAISNGEVRIIRIPETTSGEIIIPSRINGYPVTNIGDQAFLSCFSLTSVTIPDSVTSIGDYAFYGCSSLTSVTIPDSVTSIGEGAFSGCSSLTSVTIPDSVTSIEGYAFQDCSSLTSVAIPDSVTSIGDSAFEYCSSLTSVTIPDNVTSIGVCAFEGCEGLADDNGFVIVKGVLYDYYGEGGVVVIPDSVMSIGEGAFYDCSSLTSVTIPNSVTSIEGYAFQDCSSLTSVTIPEGVTSIGDWAFYECSSLMSITIPDSVTSIGAGAFEGCEGLADDNGFVIVKGVLYDYYGEGGVVVIPDSVTSIGDSAFYECSSLTSVTIPDSVTSIGVCAFSGCSSLMSVTIPDSVTSIGDYAFYKCSSLTNITIPDSVTSIGSYAFNDCSSLTSVTLPEGVTSIGDYAFSDCDSLTNITIPDSVTSIGSYAFSCCSYLKRVELPETLRSQVEDGFIFRYCPSDLEIIYMVIPNVTDDSKVSAALGGFPDVKLAANIKTAAEYAAFREWALNLEGVTPEEVKASPNAWLSYALNTDKLIEGEVTESRLKIISFKLSGENNLFSIKLKLDGVDVGDAAIVENLLKIFAIEGTKELSDDLFSVNNVALEVVQINEGEVEFIVTPRVKGSSFFFRGRMRDNINSVGMNSFIDKREKVQLWENGPYWATTNIGAEKPEDYGYCFWWGDTIGYKRENDKWVASDGSTSNFSFERGNTPTYRKGNSQLRSEGWITSDGVLALEHDAAHVHWGDDWRMPTKQEIEDLNSKCDWTWTTMNGVNGYVVRGKGDYASNSIFLPCVGTADMTSILYLGLDGGYWSSEPNPNYFGGGYASWYIFFNSSGAEVSYRNCWNGAYVRPLQGFTK